MHFIIQSFVLAVVFFLYPTASFAYIDPGVLSMLMQSIFAVVAGGVVAWVVTPWKVLKHYICSLFKKEQPESSKNVKKKSASRNGKKKK